MSKLKPELRRWLFINAKLNKKVAKDDRLPTYADLQRQWNSTALLPEEKVSERTIRRDIKNMREMLKAPVIFDSERRGLRYTETSWSMPGVMITESELFFIHVASRALEQYRNTPMHSKLQQVFDRMLDMLPETQITVDPAWAHPDISFVEDPKKIIDPKIWETISKALYQRRQVLIKHTKVGAKGPTVRKVEPYHIIGRGGGTSWYLLARCLKRDEIRLFAFQRIVHAEKMLKRYTIPEDFDPKEHLGDLGVMRAAKTYDLRVRFSKNVAPYILEREWVGQKQVETAEDGSVILSCKGETTHIEQVAHWVMAWGSGAQVLAPQELVSLVKAKLSAAAKQYK